MGLVSGTRYFVWDKLEHYYPSDIGKAHAFFVYSYIVEYGFVGDTKSQLLRSFANS